MIGEQDVVIGFWDVVIGFYDVVIGDREVVPPPLRPRNRLYDPGDRDDDLVSRRYDAAALTSAVVAGGHGISIGSRDALVDEHVP